MHLDPYIILGSAVVGFLVGMTGAGGGALMTPMLILLFSVQPSKAISSDLVAAVLMRPIGAAVHLRARTVNLRLVRLMVVGSVPMAFLGTYVLSLMGHAKSAQANIEKALGAALLVGASAMLLRYVLDRRSGQARRGVVHEVTPRPLRTIAIGMIGGIELGYLGRLGSDQVRQRLRRRCRGVLSLGGELQGRARPAPGALDEKPRPPRSRAARRRVASPGWWCRCQRTSGPMRRSRT